MALSSYMSRKVFDSVQWVEKDLCNRIMEEMLLLGFRPHTSGTRQLIDVLALVVLDEYRLCDLKHRAYPIVAERYGVSWQCVERNLRYAIESVWAYGNLTRIQQLFGFTVEAERGKPTNKAFLAQMAEYIRISHA